MYNMCVYYSTYQETWKNVFTDSTVNIISYKNSHKNHAFIDSSVHKNHVNILDRIIGKGSTKTFYVKGKFLGEASSRIILDSEGG